MRRPTPEELAAANGKTVPDVIAKGLDAVFCGINPGLYTAAVGHHFARPGNRFWPTLHKAGFTPRLFAPDEEQELLALGYGITNLVDRATAAAAELSDDELRAGRANLERKLRRFAPRVVAIVGMGAFKTAFGAPKSSLGLQPMTIGKTAIWVLPNPSGLNANYRPPELAGLYRELRRWLGAHPGRR